MKSVNVWYNSDSIGTYTVLWESVGEHFREIKLCGNNRCRKVLGHTTSMMGAQKGYTDADGTLVIIGVEKKQKLKSSNSWDAIGH